jgi:2-oxoglutarate ferredoxin oxidoreductase subunit delta
MRQGRITINPERCKGCNLCVVECKKDEIKAGNKLNRFGYAIAEFKNCGNCNACTLCAIVCPDAAIEVIEILEEVKK